jgi:hypothetical protein
MNANVQRMTALEDGLAATLTETADDIAHSECFDHEQRAEVYTILRTLTANTAQHRAMAEILAARLKEGKAHA